MEGRKKNTDDPEDKGQNIASEKTSQNKTDSPSSKQNDNFGGKEQDTDAEDTSQNKTYSAICRLNYNLRGKELNTDVEQTAKAKIDIESSIENFNVVDLGQNTNIEPKNVNVNVLGIGQNINPDKAKKAPKGIYFLLGNEFCERFSFYGMRTILTLYLTLQLDYSGNVATTIYHAFQVLCYFTPVFGAILSDSWLGKFWTILWLSVLYAFGNIIISVGAVPNDLYTMKVVSIIGLFIIAFGTGGIKPCVSAFGGDQFTEEQEEKRKYFFSMFYFSINLGSFLSTAITPVLRADIKCFGQDTCFSLAFFIPAVLFVIALILFIIGKPLYIIKPAEGSAFVSVFKCIGYALLKKATVKDETKGHWIEYADDKYDKDLIYDVKCLLNVLFIFLPLPIFWALFEQQGSKWVLQASRMNGEVFGTHIKPDHMQIINPLLILILIPVFDNVIYPLAAKCNICRSPLQRMTIGGLLSALSFAIAAIIELKIESELPYMPSEGYTDLTIINNSPCNLDIQGRFNISLNQFGYASARGKLLNKSDKWQFTPKGCSASSSKVYELTATSSFETLMVTLEDEFLKFDSSNDSRIKEKNGHPRVRLLFITEHQFTKGVNSSFLFQGQSSYKFYPNRNMTRPGKLGMTEYLTVKPSKYKLFLPSNGTREHESKELGEISVKPGGSYIIYIFSSASENKKGFRIAVTVIPNSVHMLWQIPQGIIITAGEVMYSITGLEFSYSQAPSSLKSIIQAAWLLTNAIGNLLVVLLIHFIDFQKQSQSFILFAALMAASMIVFGIMAYFYEYANLRNRKSK